MALRTDGNQRYNWMKKRRSLLVNWARPRTLRRSTISCCLSAAFSASSWLLGLRSEATKFKRKTISAAIAGDVKRFCRQTKTDEVFGTHRDYWMPRLKRGMRQPRLTIFPRRNCHERTAQDR